jgi:hypothetical protein
MIAEEREQRFEQLLAHCRVRIGGFERLVLLLADPHGEVWWIPMTAAGSRGYGVLLQR